MALLEEHGLTLPPENQPLYGLDRGAQVNWRRAALYDTQRASARAELLRLGAARPDLRPVTEVTPESGCSGSC